VVSASTAIHPMEGRLQRFRKKYQPYVPSQARYCDSGCSYYFGVTNDQ